MAGNDYRLKEIGRRKRRSTRRYSNVIGPRMMGSIEGAVRPSLQNVEEKEDGNRKI